MHISRWLSWGIVALSSLAFGRAGLAAEPIDAKKLLSQPKTYVGSEVCRTCHLEHYDAWKMTLHSRMLQDAKANADAIVTDFNHEIIKADLTKIQDKLKVAVDQVYIPKVEDILYTIGSQWKQRYLVKKDGEFFIAPTQYNAESGRWVNYHEGDWDKRPWLPKCGGCHATGVDLEKKTFAEPGVGCEACHGPGSHHAALPKTELFEKRATIVNPAKLTPGVAVEICGSCHNRGKSTKHEGASWPVGYTPGKSLETYFQSTSYASGNVKDLYPNEFSASHHQQYMDWKHSAHYTAGVTCVSCHTVHELGNPVVRAQTQERSGEKTCLTCHEMVNKVGAHSIHAFGNCVGCHMPRIVKSAESGDISSHVFVTLLPKDSLENPGLPNSCQGCHKHKDEDMKDLQRRYDELTTRTSPAQVSSAPTPPSGG